MRRCEPVYYLFLKYVNSIFFLISEYNFAECSRISFLWYLTNKFVCRYEFEQTKKNNLLFYGIANDPRETAFQVAKSDNCEKELLNLRVKAEM